MTPSAPAEQLRTPLWNFAVRVYGSDGVQPECLALQERFGADVNLVLFSVYAGAVEKVTLAADDLTAAADIVAHWHDDVVRKIRHARQSLKAWSAGEDLLALQAANLRDQVKSIELDSERLELFMLWSWLQGRAAAMQHGDRAGALAQNLRAILVRYGALDQTGNVESVAPRLLRAATDYGNKP